MAAKAKRQSQKQELFDAAMHAASCMKEAGDPLHGLGPSQQYADAFNRYSQALKALLAGTRRDVRKNSLIRTGPDHSRGQREQI